MAIISLARTFVSVGTAAIVCIVLYDYSIFSMGLPLLVFVVVLMAAGWGFGVLMTSLLVLYSIVGLSSAFATIALLTPISGIYYPIATLSDWLRPIAMALPPAYVFEGMHAQVFEGVFRIDLAVTGALVTCVWIGIGAGTFLYAMYLARCQGLLLNVGE